MGMAYCVEFFPFVHFGMNNLSSCLAGFAQLFYDNCICGVCEDIIQCPVGGLVSAQLATFGGCEIVSHVASMGKGKNYSYRYYLLKINDLFGFAPRGVIAR